MDLVQEPCVEISTQTSLKLADLLNQETRLQRMRRTCLESYVYTMDKFCGIALNVLSIGELACPSAALYFIYLSPSETPGQQHENNNYSGIFITISLFCSTIKQLSEKIISLRKKLIACCGVKIENAQKNGQEKSDRSSDSD